MPCKKISPRAAYIDRPRFLTIPGNGTRRLLERSTRDENRRTVYVRLTDLGREQCRRLNAIFAAAEEEALRGFSPQEMQQVQTLLERIYHNLNN